MKPATLGKDDIMRFNKANVSISIGILTLVIAAIPAYAAVIHVPADYTTIQAAVTAAAPGDTVLIADGTYSGSGNVNIDPAGKDLVIQSENGPSACIIDCENTTRAFFIHSGETSAFRIEGLRIINGYNSLYGGGIYCRQYSHPVISGCEFYNCQAGDYGGGIYITFHSDTEIIDCVFEQNTAVYGGGLATGTSCNVIVTNCVFAENTGTQGGAMRAGGSESVAIVSCTFTNNSGSNSGGGLNVFNIPDFTISHCTFEGNTSGYGGGVYMEYVTSLTLEYSTFTANEATEWGGGARLSLADDCATISHCDFVSNSTPLTSISYGGGLYLQGAQIMSDCTFIGNSSFRGGGMWQSGGTSLTDCRFEQNTAGEKGGGLHMATVASWRYPCVENCEFVSNAAGTGGGLSLYSSNSYPIHVWKCRFDGNEATDFGGALFSDYGEALIIQTVFHNNSATGGYGGATEQEEGLIRFYNCLWYNNSCSIEGGGHYNYIGITEIFNCTFSDNTSPSGGGRQIASRFTGTVSCYNSIIGTWDYSGEMEIYDEDERVDAEYCAVYGGWPGIGNTDQDPLFVNGLCDDGDYYLSSIDAGQGADSPCLNTGSDLAANLAYPICGGTMTMDTLVVRTDNFSDSGTVDMGFHYPICLELTPTPTQTETPSPTPSETPTETPSFTPSTTPTITPTITPTGTATSIPPVPATGSAGLVLLMSTLSLLLFRKREYLERENRRN